ncbi:MAG: hypothetical protein HZA89_00550 [Verrucomicrobia bacterium]|nr:hypothetical protein [Verrucomicrobiota bacterium]
MTTKRILVLANSTKHHPKSCVAGRELIDEGDGKTRWSGWIRPVSNHDEGALDFAERRLAGGTDPRPLDVIRVPVRFPENNPLQPENWLIAPGQPWTKHSSVDVHDLFPLVEEPQNLWLQPRQQNDRVHQSFLQQLPEVRSLYLIKPERFSFEIRSKTWNNETKKKMRAGFSYRKQYYSLALEDPLIVRKYFPDFSKAADGDTPINRPVLLCVSLPQEFKEFKEPGFHFKVVATVFELPA